MPKDVVMYVIAHRKKKQNTKNHSFEIYVRNKKAKLYGLLTFMRSSFANDSVHILMKTFRNIYAV